MSKNNFAARLLAVQKEYFRAGEHTGEQYSSDCYQRAMLEAGISKPKIREIAKAAQKIINERAGMFDVKDPEADYLQEVFDRPLREIWGDEFVDHEARYDYMKQIKY